MLSAVLVNEATMFAKEQQKRTDYTVKKVETVAAGKDVQARLFTLSPGEVIPWHSHSEIADHFFVLDGELTVETRAPDGNALPSSVPTIRRDR
jgi:quercetin dioxygenase-like cupin family protein